MESMGAHVFHGFAWTSCVPMESISFPHFHGCRWNPQAPTDSMGANEFHGYLWIPHVGLRDMQTMWGCVAGGRVSVAPSKFNWRVGTHALKHVDIHGQVNCLKHVFKFKSVLDIPLILVNTSAYVHMSCSDTYHRGVHRIWCGLLHGQ